MSALSIQVPFPVFNDRDGQPLDNGYVWIGVPNLPPQTNPVNVYFDDALTILAPQPLRTINGYISRFGSPAQVYIDGVDFSILVQDSKGSMVYNFPEGTGISPNASGVAFTGFKGQVGFVSDLADDDGSDWIGFEPAGAGAVARSAQDKLRETVSVKDFGAVGDGVTDDTAAIQSAINVGGTIFIPKATYKVNGTLTLVSNLELYAEPGTKFLAQFTPESTGGYSNSIINTSNVSNIRIINIDFDFNKPLPDGGLVQGPGLTTTPGLSFTNCDDVLLENVTLQNYTTPLNTDLTTLQLGLTYRCCIFYQCENVQVNSLTMLQIREEGLYFNNCVNVSVKDTYAYSLFQGTSTFFGFVYCDGVILSGANVTLTGGSVVNCYSRNVLIENLKLNEGISNTSSASIGRGIDLANEFNVQRYDTYNIIVRNCYLNCTRYGIQGGAYSESEGTDVLTIENNDIYVLEENNILAGIRIDTASTVNVSNNRVVLSPATLATNGRCILLSFNDKYPKETGNINVVGNTLKGNCGIGIVPNATFNCNGIYIRNNTFTADDLGSKNHLQGAANFFHIRNTTSGKLAVFKNIQITGNVLFNLAGSVLAVLPDFPADIEVGDVVIDGNQVNAPVGQLAQRTGEIINPKNAGIVNTVRISNNTFVDPQFIRVSGFYHVLIYQNLLHWNTVTSTNQFQIVDCGPGYLTVKNNDFYNHNGSFNEVKNNGGNNFNVIHVLGNTNYNQLGVIEFDTDFVNSSVPN